MRIEEAGALLRNTLVDLLANVFRQGCDPGDNELTFRTWSESLEMAELYQIPVLYIFSNQIEPLNGI